MTEEPFYREYVEDERFAEGYVAYQERYAATPRESDRVLMRLVADEVARRPRGAPPLRLLDIGCSTGNLLLHLRGAFPGLHLTGGELMPSALAACRANPALAGVAFEELDMLDLPEGRFDVVVANAVLYMFGEPEFLRALASVRRALAPGGAFLAFDLVHLWDQELEVRESSETHPDGLMLHLRPWPRVDRELAAAGFAERAHHPFAIPIDLPRPDRPGDMTSYTATTAGGERLLFRGALAQPWCHLVARVP